MYVNIMTAQCQFKKSYRFLTATLTSYSENAEHGGKHNESSRGSLKFWQAQKSMGADSFLYRVDENMAASTYSLNKIPERSLEHSVSHSAHSIPLYLMPRPNSVAGKFMHLSGLGYCMFRIAYTLLVKCLQHTVQ